jgi:WD40 repeat protein
MKKILNFIILLVILTLKNAEPNNVYDVYDKQDLSNSFKNTSTIIFSTESVLINKFDCLASASSLKTANTILFYHRSNNLRVCTVFNETAELLNQDIISTQIFTSMVLIKKNSSSKIKTTSPSYNPEPIKSMALLKNGLLATGSIYGLLNLWDLAQAVLIKQVKLVSSSINSILELISGDLACAFDDRVIRIFGIPSGVLKQTITEKAPVYALVLLNNGFIASGSRDKANSVKIFDPTNNTAQLTLSALNEITYSLCVLKNGDLVGGAYLKFVIWNTTDWSVKKNISAHRWYLTSIAELQNGYLATGSMDFEIIIWDIINNGTKIKTLLGHKDYVTSLVALNNGDLVSGSRDSTIRIWDTNSWSVKRNFTGHTSCVNSLVVLNNGTLASGSNDTTIKFWPFF